MGGYLEGQSTTRPPLFDGKNYAFWEERMRIFIQSTDFRIWMLIEHGETPSTNSPSEYTGEDFKNLELSAKARNILFCGVNGEDYNKISRCKTAQEMWRKLELTYEGTSQVKQSKIDQLIHEYELFHMKEDEKVEEMFERFSKFINNLGSL